MIFLKALLKLALALLANRFCEKITTEEMRSRWAIERFMRNMAGPLNEVRDQMIKMMDSLTLACASVLETSEALKEKDER